MEQALSTRLLELNEPSRIAECRRIARVVAEEEGLSPEQVSNAAIVASEVASNLLKHAREGVVQVAPLSPRGAAGVEILSIDRGPGLSPGSFEDGYSATGTSGTGLGAIRRLSDDFDVYSGPSKGTALVSRILLKAPPRPAAGNFTLGLTERPLESESVSGDRWAVRRGQNTILMMVADGLGHGLLANEASSAAAAAFLAAKEELPGELVQIMHRALRGTRGAAVAVSQVDFAAGRVKFAGLGNIVAVVSDPAKSHSMVSHNGTAGHEVRNIKEFEYPWTSQSVIIMHSDGLSANWNLDAHAGLRQRHPSVIAGCLYREAARKRDDACVIVGGKR